jgi:hypothetical protein
MRSLRVLGEKQHRAGYGPHCKVRQLPTSWNEPEVFEATWNGQTSPARFNSAGAARAYLATCDVARRLRA